MKQFYVYILSTRERGLYIGVTSDLIKRGDEDKHYFAGGFNKIGFPLSRE